MKNLSPTEIDLRHYCNMSFKFILALALFYMLSSLTLSATPIIETITL